MSRNNEQGDTLSIERQIAATLQLSNFAPSDCFGKAVSLDDTRGRLDLTCGSMGILYADPDDRQRRSVFGHSKADQAPRRRLIGRILNVASMTSKTDKLEIHVFKPKYKPLVRQLADQLVCALGSQTDIRVASITTYECICAFEVTESKPRHRAYH